MSLSSSPDSTSPLDTTRVGQPSTGAVSNALKSYTGTVGSKDNSAKSALSRDSIKSRLRSKHLKRTPSIRFVSKEDDNDNNAEGQHQQQSSDPRLDLIVSMLMKGLKDNDVSADPEDSEKLEKSVKQRPGSSSSHSNNNRQLLPSVPKSSTKQITKTYFDYSADSGNEPAPSQLYIDVSGTVSVIDCVCACGCPLAYDRSELELGNCLKRWY